MGFVSTAMEAVPEAAQPAQIALRDLTERHADFIWRSLRRMGVPEGAADDATQQVFLTASRKLGSIAPGRERAFLFGIAMNVAAHARRATARTREVPCERFEMADPAPSPDELLDRERARALLDEVLEAMSIDLRVVFVLFELEEMTMAEIASLTGLPAGTVASRLRRAREEFAAIAQRVRLRQGRER